MFLSVKASPGPQAIGPTSLSLLPSHALPLLSLFLALSHSTSLSLSHLSLCDLCLTSVITAPTAAADRFRWGEVQTCPIT